MPRKTNTAAADKAALPRIPAELLEQLIPGPVTPGQLEDIFQRFKKAFIERALGAEMSHHLGYAPGQAKPDGAVNHRNGKSAKRVLTDPGALAIAVPRDRHGSFEPQLIGKHERRFTGFDDKIIAMTATSTSGAGEQASGCCKHCAAVVRGWRSRSTSPRRRWPRSGDASSWANACMSLQRAKSKERWPIRPCASCESASGS